MIVVACPACGTRREVDEEEFELILECRQFMCWDVCGMDVSFDTPWRLVPGFFEEDED